nr:DUF3854 domain-containing protein [Bacillus cereus]
MPSCNGHSFIYSLELCCNKTMGVEKVYLAFDADLVENKKVRKALIDFATELKQVGYNVIIAAWNPTQGKGLDDTMQAGFKPVFQRL